jgi:hypothetical protein
MLTAEARKCWKHPSTSHEHKSLQDSWQIRYHEAKYAIIRSAVAQALTDSSINLERLSAMANAMLRAPYSDQSVERGS